MKCAKNNRELNPIKNLVLLCAAVLSWLAGELSPAFSQPTYEQVRREDVAPGVRYYHFLNELMPVSFNMLRVHWRESFILPRTILGDDMLFNLQPVSEQARQVSTPARYAVAAVNGDFYKAIGVPLGLFIVERELISAPTNGRAPRTSFIIGDRGRPDVDDVEMLGKLRDPHNRTLSIDGVNRLRDGGSLILYTPAMGDKTPTDGGVEVILKEITGADRDRWRCYPGESYTAIVERVRSGGGSAIPRRGAVLSGSGSKGDAISKWKAGSKIKFRFDFVGGNKMIKSAISGWPVLVRNGKNIRKLIDEPRHPRTAIGYNDKEIILVTVDGRRAGWSRGMTLYELAELMESAKCEEALNLDGGGSTTMWIRGNIKNKPSDGKERSVANAFVIYSTAPKTRLSRLVIDPPELSILTNEEIQFTVKGQDKYFNPADLDITAVKWSVSDNVGSISPRGTFTSASYESVGFVKVSYGGLYTIADVRVYTAPPIFTIYPATVNLFEGETFQFRTIASDHGGRRIIGSYENRLKWEVTPGLGNIDNQGNFYAGKQTASGWVSVAIGDVVRRAKVTVGTVGKLVDGFERKSVWSFASFPDNTLKGEFLFTADAAYQGSFGGVLRYAFTDAATLQACYAKTDIPVYGTPMGISVWVRGDGSSHELRLAYRDRRGKRFTVPFSENALKDSGWHKVSAKIPPNTEFPIRIESIYILKDSEGKSSNSGSIKLDELTAHYPPD